MTVEKPSLGLLRTLTEEHVLRVVMEHGQLTRSQIAALTGISKPTISDGVGRLVEVGLLIDTGTRKAGRGRVPTYYSLAPESGAALVVSIRPTGLTAESIDPFGSTLASGSASLRRGSGPETVADALKRLTEHVHEQTKSPLRVAVISAADPVDRATGRLVPLPDAPFLVGDLDPTAAIGSLVEGMVLVDNDVNWAARTERMVADLSDPDNFFYLHLGEGLGCAVVCDGEVWRGHGGLAGEIAHLVTTGPSGEAIRLIEVFSLLGLRRPRSTAIDVNKLRAATASNDARRTLAVAVSGALSAAVALADPSTVVVGGAWGRDDEFLDSLRETHRTSPRNLPILRSHTEEEHGLTAARATALEHLRQRILANSAN